MSAGDDAVLVVNAPADLDAGACLRVADGRPLALGDVLVDALDRRRAQLLTRLVRGDAVYGVTTGMGAASGMRLDPRAQSLQQQNLMRARSIGSAPWLSEHRTRLALVVRLRTLLEHDAAVSSGLCRHLVEMLNRDVLPAIPARRLGAAGEIIPLAHLGAVVIGDGRCLVPGGGGTRDTEKALAEARLAPFELGPKEGVALIEGVPVATGLALDLVRQTSILGRVVETALGAELALTGASRDPLRDAVIRGDDVLLAIARRVLQSAGSESPASALQAPVSFRVTGPALAHLERSAAALASTARRALDGVTDSPAFVDDDFVGTAGFDGFELAAGFDALRVAAIHLAELSAARLHRLLDDRITGLPRQLSARPGLDAGMVTVHKRAAGVVHELVRTSAPASLGLIETSLGQEDAQSFALEAADACSSSLSGLRDVLACELLTVVQAHRLAGPEAQGPGREAPRPEAPRPEAPRPRAPWPDIDAMVAPGTADRAFGLDVDALVAWLAARS